MDEDIVEECWRGSVPVILQLATTELTQQEMPKLLPLMLSRQSYLPTYNTVIRDHFETYTASREDCLWYSCSTLTHNEDIPLQWQLPIGVLYDMFIYHHYNNKNNDNMNNYNNNIQSTQLTTTWNITVHFQCFPSDILTRCVNIYTLRTSVLNDMKQALYMRYNMCKLTTVLSSHEQQQLWHSIDECDYQQYHNIMSKLLIAHHDVTMTSQWHACSFRIMLVNFNEDVQSQYIPMQRPVSPYISSNPEHHSTLYHALHSLIPQIFVDTASKNEDNNDNNIATLYDDINIYIQGIEVPLSSPLKWLCKHMASADQLLYVIVRRMSLKPG